MIMNNITQVWPSYIEPDITPQTHVISADHVGGGNKTDGTVYTQLVVSFTVPFERSAPIMGGSSGILVRQIRR